MNFKEIIMSHALPKIRRPRKGKSPGSRKQGSDVAWWERKEIPRMAGRESPSGTASLECNQSRLMEKDGHTQESELFEKNETYRIPDEFEFEGIFNSVEELWMK